MLIYHDEPFHRRTKRILRYATVNVRDNANKLWCHLWRLRVLINNKIKTEKNLVRQELNAVCLAVSLSVSVFCLSLQEAVHLFIPEHQ